MTSPIIPCPIWGDNFLAKVQRRPLEGIIEVLYSPRAGGGYFLEYGAEDEVKQLRVVQKAILTTWLIDQRQTGTDYPRVTEGVLEYIKTKRPLPVHERADRLLRFISDKTPSIGDYVHFSPDDPDTLAKSESNSLGEVRYLVNYLKDEGLVEVMRHRDGIFTSRVTVSGFGHIAEQVTNVDLAQAFVAMWFDPSMDDAYYQGIEPAIREAGYKPYRVDRAEDYIGKIDDQIIAEIRRSKFLVADFTYGKKVRGGVYFEAGFALGLNLPVIFLCKKDRVDKDPDYLHFDTNHYYHILWIDAKDLTEKLRNRVRASIGQGPLLPNQ